MWQNAAQLMNSSFPDERWMWQCYLKDLLKDYSEDKLTNISTLTMVPFLLPEA